jgi:hypothetical protein
MACKICFPVSRYNQNQQHIRLLFIFTFILIAQHSSSQNLQVPIEGLGLKNFGNKGVSVSSSDRKGFCSFKSVQNLDKKIGMLYDERIIRDDKNYIYSRGKKMFKTKIL